MATLSDLERALRDVNVQAFLRVIRERESNQNEDAYSIINGGEHFTDFSHHPFGELTTTHGGKASGAYQFLPTTWAGLVRSYGFTDFSPHNQDLGAVALILERGALGDVQLGDFGHAVPKLRSVWTSLPGASESTGSWTMEKAAAVYIAYGGQFAGQFPEGETPAHFDPAPAVPAPTTGSPMPIFLALLPTLLEMIPALAPLLSKGKVSEQTAQVVTDALTKATNTAGIGAALDRMAADPEVKVAAVQAVTTDPTIMALMEVGGGIAAARTYALQVQESDKPMLRNPMFVMSLLLLPIIYWIMGAVLNGGPDSYFWGIGFSQETRSGIINIVIGMVLGGICGAFLGTTFANRTKDDTINTLSRSQT